MNPPGVAVLLTGDGAGHFQDEGFLTTLKGLRMSKWNVEVLSWMHCVNRYLFEWVKENGCFIPLDEYYESITFTITLHSMEDAEEQTVIRRAKSLKLSTLK